MDLSKRIIENTVVVDLGQPPQTTEDFQAWGQSIVDALAGHDGPVILNLYDTRGFRSTHVGVLVQALRRAGRWHGRDSRPVSVVTTEDRLQQVFWFSQIPAYGTVEEALAARSHRSRGHLIALAVTGLAVVILAVVLLTVR